MEEEGFIEDFFVKERPKPFEGQATQISQVKIGEQYSYFFENELKGVFKVLTAPHPIKDLFGLYIDIEVDTEEGKKKSALGLSDIGIMPTESGLWNKTGRIHPLNPEILNNVVSLEEWKKKREK